MDEVERQRANREAKARAAATPAAHEFGVLRYLAAESYVTRHAKNEDEAAADSRPLAGQRID